MSMTGTQIKQVLRHGIKNQQYGMVQFSGLRIQYNASSESDKRILKVTLADGTPLAGTKHHRVKDYKTG
jgi:2',3'-cyclic-nucleotide 2'-phosphodiesterase/3'-nucleotidase